MRKMEKVPRGIQCQKSSKGKFEKSGLNYWSTSKSQKGGRDQVSGRVSVPSWYTLCKCSMETAHNLVKVKLGIKVMKLVESLIRWEFTVGQRSEFDSI